MQSKKLRLILGDQLNEKHSWFQKLDNDTLYVLMEIRTETDYASHHIQKIVAFFSAMREFADLLKEKGHKVQYIKIDDPKNKQDFAKNLLPIIANKNISKLEIMEPDEYRLDLYFAEFFKKLDIETEVFSSEHFMADRHELEAIYGNKKSYLMENFYRHMRVKHQILMEGSKPRGGKWNFDKENRKKVPKGEQIPKHAFPKNDVSKIYKTISKLDIKTIGSMPDPEAMIWPVNRKQALKILNDFLKNLLAKFGTYQDAMSTENYFLFHSCLSFALNSKMISPKEVIEKSIDYYEKNQEQISIAQIEGFTRQILGWREFMRCFYWSKMPGFAKSNIFKHQKKLPNFYWDANTKMNCLKHVISSSLENAYAHHIQRLMLTGNFALLAGIDPDEVDKWYLGIYIDALEWVEITNTRGMSQWADGGGLATKPYISSANYINKMSDYCKNCHYNYKEKHGKGACPFNSLYWNFLTSNKSLLEKNHRMSMVYNVWNKFPKEEQTLILEQAQEYLKGVENL